MIFTEFVKNSTANIWTAPPNDVEYNDDSHEDEPHTAPVLAYKRQVSFRSAQQNNLNEKSSTLARSISSPAKVNR
ncbi:unnamed protein product, partial [Rotaria magnacalcarata]